MENASAAFLTAVQQSMTAIRKAVGAGTVVRRLEPPRNGAALWQSMKTRGFTGSLRVVTEWTTRKRKYWS